MAKNRVLGGTMFRALAISIAVHFAIFISLGCFESPYFFEARGVQKQPLNLVFRQKDESLPRLLAIQPTVPPISPGPRHGERSRPAQQKKLSGLIFPGFSPSTVRTESSALASVSRVTEAQSAEMPLVSEEAISAYRLNIARAARQFKRYPVLARENGWEGTVVVSVALILGRVEPIVSLEQSSGYVDLDGQALEMVGQAVRLAALPTGSRFGGMRIRLPVVYRLADNERLITE